MHYSIFFRLFSNSIYIASISSLQRSESSFKQVSALCELKIKGTEMNWGQWQPGSRKKHLKGAGVFGRYNMKFIWFLPNVLQPVKTQMMMMMMKYNLSWLAALILLPPFWHTDKLPCFCVVWYEGTEKSRRCCERLNMCRGECHCFGGEFGCYVCSSLDASVLDLSSMLFTAYLLSRSGLHHSCRKRHQGGRKKKIHTQ